MISSEASMYQARIYIFFFCLSILSINTINYSWKICYIYNEDCTQLNLLIKTCKKSSSPRKKKETNKDIKTQQFEYRFLTKMLLLIQSDVHHRLDLFF